MGCGCSGMRGLGAPGASLVFYDLNPSGQVRVLTPEAKAALDALFSNPVDFGAAGLLSAYAIPTGYGSAQLAMLPAVGLPAGAVPVNTWIAAQIADNSAVGVDARSGGLPASIPDLLAANLVLYAGDPETIAGPSSPGEVAMGWGYTPWDATMLRAWQDKKSAPAPAPVIAGLTMWNGPVPWLIGGAAVLGLGAYFLSRRKSR